MADADSFISSQAFACFAKISQQKARRALARAALGHPWRDHRLVVRKAHGRGGKSGTQYLVLLSSLPIELQRRWRDEHGEPDADALPPITVREGQAVAIYDPDEPLSRRRRPRADRGDRRERITRRFRLAMADTMTPADEERIAAALESFAGGLWRKLLSWRQVVDFASDRLFELASEIAPGLPKAELRRACALSRSFVERFKRARVVGIAEKDAKQFHDKYVPRIRRHRRDLLPMQLVVADVRHCDVLMTRADGSPFTPKVIAWYDLATNRTFATLLFLPPRRGVRQEDVKKSFIEMVQHPQFGVPARLYLDNGSEFRGLDALADVLRLADWTHVAVKSLSDDRDVAEWVAHDRRIIRARAYNAPAKPIEGAFGVWAKIMEPLIVGYVGGDRMDQKTKNVGKSPETFPGGPEELARDFYLLLEYMHGLPRRGHLNGRSPNEAFSRFVENGWKPFTVTPEAMAVAFGEHKHPIADRGCITVNNLVYRHGKLLPLTGERVTAILPVAAGDGHVYILDGNDKFLCAAELAAEYAFTDRAGAREQQRRAKIMRRHVAELRDATDDIDMMELVRRKVALNPPAPVPECGGVIRLSDADEAAGRALKEAAAPRKLTRMEEEEHRRGEKEQRIARLLGRSA